MAKAHKDLQNHIITLINDSGGTAINVEGIKGVSDIVACYKGIFLAVEVKIPPDRLKPKQAQYLHDINKAGGIGVVVKPKTLVRFSNMLMTLSAEHIEAIRIIYKAMIHTEAPKVEVFSAKRFQR